MHTCMLYAHFIKHHIVLKLPHARYDPVASITTPFARHERWSCILLLCFHVFGFAICTVYPIYVAISQLVFCAQDGFCVSCRKISKHP